jgi:glyoxylase-like metal-dependent hydrolase (beta-lactamase superfamily II)/ferredoxin
MARLADRAPENVPGDFYVDRSCINCDTCRQIAPMVFGDGNGQACVKAQPDQPEEERRALMALVSCPTSSIGTAQKRDPRPGIEGLPEAIGEGLYYCGFASADSYGAASYLVTRPEGNVLIDSPRAAKPLLGQLQRLGGVSLLFLSHRDDVADHAVFARRFGCTRVLHRRDLGRDTSAVERLVDGDEPVALGRGLLAIPVPGHTRGSTALLVDDRYLFTGDHLWWDEGRLSASRSVCWYSWAEQRRSLARLLDFRFEWVLPGHGYRWRAPSAAAMRAELERLIARLEPEAKSE